jgi:hypothetical protein
MSSDPRPKTYVARRTLEGRSQKKVIRCLKRHVAREVFHLLTKPRIVVADADLRGEHLTAGLALAVAAEPLGTWPIRLFELERGLAHDAELVRRSQLWPRPKQLA